MNITPLDVANVTVNGLATFAKVGLGGAVLVASISVLSKIDPMVVITGAFATVVVMISLIQFMREDKLAGRPAKYVGRHRLIAKSALRLELEEMHASWKKRKKKSGYKFFHDIKIELAQTKALF
jgi:hypothetical protein